MGVRNVYGINTYDGYVGDDGNGNYQGETGPVKGKTTVNNDKGKGTKAKAVSATVVAGTAISAGAMSTEAVTALSLTEIMGTLGAIAVASPYVILTLLMKGDKSDINDVAIPAVGTKSKKEDYITLYRGVGESAGVYYAAAKKGIAVPKGFSSLYSHEIPDDHTMGDNYSIWTSWTSDRSVADTFSTGPLGNDRGVILEKTFHKSMLIKSGLAKTTFSGEGEWLVPGVVTGAKVFSNKISLGKR